MGDLPRLLASLSDDVGNRGREFERICKWFLENDPVYQAELDRVWLWADWPGRWGADAGIDLVAKDRRGRLWAIQAKAYSPERSITKADLDTFLSESSRPDFSFRLLIGTTDLIGTTARRTIDAQEKPVSMLLRSDLVRAPVNWPSSPRALRAAKVPRKRPRSHQRTAIRDVVSGLSQHDRGKLVMACGTGKTLVSLFTAEKLEARRVLVLLPSLSLLSQTLTEWTANAAEPLELLAVCSDDKVVDADAVVASTSDLGLPVTTEPGDIATFLRGRGPRMRVVFATYQSSPRVAEAMSLGRVPRFDLAIADEAHRCTGRVSSDFATILDNSLIRARRRLFMTATPRYFTGRVIKEAQEADFEIASMDNEATFGPTLHRLTFAQAIEKDLLTDYQVAIIGVDDATYLDWARNGRFVTTDGTEVTDARTLAAQIGLAKALRKFDLRRTITFHSRVAAARRFSEELPGVISWMPARQRPKGTLTCDYVSGTMNAGIRNTRLRQLRDPETDRAILSNARCLTEGIDVPSLDAVAFIDPRRSEVDIVQAVGRAIRKASDKSLGTIVIPVFIASGQDAAVTLSDSAFKPVWDVVNALRAHDEDLAECLDDLRRKVGASQDVRLRLPAKLKFDLPAHVSADFAAAMSLRLVEQTTSTWQGWFGLLTKHVDRTGSARVSLTHEENGRKLGHWVNNQRTHRPKLSNEQTSLLEGLPGWSWTPMAEMWDESFARLRRFAEHEGTTRVPYDMIESGFPIGRWVVTQRSRRHALGEDRRSRLESLPGWSWNPMADDWDEAFAAAKDFSKSRGNLRVPKGHRAGGVHLKAWIIAQRTGRDALSPEQVTRLESLPGWSWDPYGERWEEAFALLLLYVEREGHARVPGGHVEDGFSLGSWVSIQRSNREQLPLARRSRLDRIAGWTWDPFSDDWENGYRRLSEYVDRVGTARVARSHVEHGFKLGQWVGRQRDIGNRLLEGRRRRLESLPGWTWEYLDDRWEESFDALRAFVAREGHSRVPANHVEGQVRLGRWITQQRMSRDRMTDERRVRLEVLPGWAWKAKEAQWEDSFALLCAYSAREGHANVPRPHVEGGFRLGAWVSSQRSHRTHLNSDRVIRLESLPGWRWNLTSDVFEEAFERLAWFCEREGHAKVPVGHNEQGFPLGKWVVTRRATKERLSAEQVRRLQSLPGWTWDPRADAWERGFASLLSFSEREGHARVPRSHVEDGFSLGQWVRVQRTARGRMPQNRALRLESLSGWLWSDQGGRPRDDM